MAECERRERGGVAFWTSPLLASLGVAHGFSTRNGGVSAAPFDSLNLGRAGGVASELSDPQANRTENLLRFLAALGIAREGLHRIMQVHGARVVDAGAMRVPAGIGSATSTGTVEVGTAEADALIGTHSGESLMITVADCAPILLACPRSGVFAAAHAGWRGVVAGVIESTLSAMAERCAVPSEIRAAIGPCIGIGAFEVGEEVADAFRARDLDRAVHPRSGRRPTLDLGGAVEVLLRRGGVVREHIDRSTLCTVSSDREFFSHRRDGPRSGRMAAIIACGS